MIPWRSPSAPLPSSSPERRKSLLSKSLTTDSRLTSSACVSSRPTTRGSKESSTRRPSSSRSLTPLSAPSMTQSWPPPERPSTRPPPPRPPSKSRSPVWSQGPRVDRPLHRRVRGPHHHQGVCAQLEKMISERDAQIDFLTKNVSSMEMELSRLKAQIASLQKELSAAKQGGDAEVVARVELESLLTTKDDEIAFLTNMYEEKVKALMSI